MITTALLLLSLAAVTARAEDPKPLLAVPGKVILEAKLDGAPGAPWKAAKGKWEAADDTMRGSELVEDKHGAVLRIPHKMQDFTIEYEFKFERPQLRAGARRAPCRSLQSSSRDHRASRSR